MSITKRKSKVGKKTYSYEVNFTYKENGITKRHFKGGFKTKKEAQDYEALTKAQIQKQGALKSIVKKTLREVYEEFLELGRDQYQHNTIINTQKEFNGTILKDLGDIPIQSFTFKFLQKYFNSRSSKSLERNKNIKKSLNRVLNYAIKVEYIENNNLPLVTIKGISQTRDTDRTLSIEDLETMTHILKEKNEFKYDAYSIALQVGYYTGLRVSEVLALEKEDVDLLNDEIFVNRKLNYKGLKKEEFYSTHIMKSKKSKAIIPLAPPLKAVLIKWFSINPYEKIICDEDGNFMNPNILSSDVKKAIKHTDIKFNFHMLRHTFSTNLYLNNVDIKTMQDLMRHSSINTTLSTYTHMDKQHKKEVISNVFKNKCGNYVGNQDEKEKEIEITLN